MVGKIRLIVAIEDDIYLDRICDYLETAHGRFVTERYSSREALAAAVHTLAVYDAILFERQMLDDSALSSIRKIKILLGEKDSMKLENGCYSIREFQKTEAIANAVLSICSQDERFIGIQAQSSEKARLYVFASPTGGSGTTTVSLSTAMSLAAKGRKVLYINLEQISSLGCFLPLGGITMTQIMRMAIENNPKLMTAVEGGRNIEPASGLEYISGFADITDFDALKPEYLKSFAEQLSTLGLYDSILIDAPWNTNQILPLINSAEKIFLVSRNTNLSVMRINAFLQYAAQKEHPYRNRLHVVLNALSGSQNSALAVSPSAVLPMYPMLIDATNFVSAAFGRGPFSDACAELARQL